MAGRVVLPQIDRGRRSHAPASRPPPQWAGWPVGHISNLPGNVDRRPAGTPPVHGITREFGICRMPAGWRCCSLGVVELGTEEGRPRRSFQGICRAHIRSRRSRAFHRELLLVSSADCRVCHPPAMSCAGSLFDTSSRDVTWYTIRVVGEFGKSGATISGMILARAHRACCWLAPEKHRRVEVDTRNRRTRLGGYVSDFTPRRGPELNQSTTKRQGSLQWHGLLKPRTSR